MVWIGSKDIYSLKSPLDEKDRLIITDGKTSETKQTLARDVANLIGYFLKFNLVFLHKIISYVKVFKN